ncbi:MAG TPA: S1C family serine protease [Pirellulaceae bacterium]|jgi:serine protease Do|nr:S1C family serine protease [Pirellulaceae bacterium]
MTTRTTGSFVATLLFASLVCLSPLRAQSLAGVVDEVQPKIVKIYGAGGFAGLEAYQSGFLISGEGHVLTVFSYVLDTEPVGVTLDDGRRFDATLVGHDPRLDLAVLKIEAQDLPHFNLDATASLEAGDRVLAFSNLFEIAYGEENASVLHGVVAAKSPLTARRGAFKTPYRGPAYILDAMTNNPGAFGGAVTDHQGRLAALIGKELRDSRTNAWLNYALPIEELLPSIDAIRQGKLAPRDDLETATAPVDPVTLESTGLSLITDVLDKTPPFVGFVRFQSPAAKAGVRPDDLVLFVNGQIVPSVEQFLLEIAQTDKADGLELTLQRDEELVEAKLVFDE